MLALKKKLSHSRLRTCTIHSSQFTVHSSQFGHNYE